MSNMDVTGFLRDILLLKIPQRKNTAEKEHLQTAPDHHCSDPQPINQLHLRHPATPMNIMAIWNVFFMVSSQKLTTALRFLNLRKTSRDPHAPHPHPPPPPATHTLYSQHGQIRIPSAKHNRIVFSTSEHLARQVSVGPFFQRP